MPEETRQLQRKLSDTENALKKLRSDFERIIKGAGLIVMHGTRLEVDESVRISDLTRKIANLTQRIEYIESITGTSTTTPTTDELRLGNWRFFAPVEEPYEGLIYSGNTLFTQVDLNEGLTTEPDWETRGEDSL